MANNKKNIKIDADISEFKKNITKASESIRLFNNELKLNQAQLKGNENNTNLLSDRLNLLKSSFNESTVKISNLNKEINRATELYGEDSKEVKQLKNQLMYAKIEQQNIANEIAKVNKELLEQSNKLILSGNSLKEFGDKTQSIGNGIENLGNKLSIVSAGVATVAGATVKASIDYESSFAGVKKTVNATDEQLEELNIGIIEMSKRMPASASSIAEVSEAAGQLGISTENILDFTEVMINLGEATNLTADEAASNLAKFANVTNMSADNYEKLGSTIVALGNNMATTEKDIVDMGTNLAATGDLVGISQAQIMALAATMSSLGIEAEAGGSAMSKLLKKIQVAVETGSSDLKKYAKIANMTGTEFKKAFQEDAVGALSAFISGLNDTERNGKSAVSILNDMGLTEVRLSSTILSLANSNGLMTNAINLANEAWEENTALSNEVEQRYSTTESQMKMLKNEVVALAIEFGDELVPVLRDGLEVIKPLISKVEEGIVKFSNLDDETKNNVIQFLMFTAAAGPVVKVTSNLIDNTGKLIKRVGETSESIGKYILKLKEKKVAEELANGVAKNSVSTLESTSEVAKVGATNVSALSTAFSGLAICTVLVGGLVVFGNVMTELIYKDSEMKSKTDDLVNSTNNYKSSLDKIKSTQQEYLNTNISEIDNLQRLKNELTSLVDENGRVKDGYENRVNFILNELNNAFNTEYTLTDGVISKYGELSENIDNLINKKKAKIILDSHEAAYTEAINKQGEATKNLMNLDNQLKVAQEELTKAQADNAYYGTISSNMHLSKCEKNLQRLQEAYDTQKGVVETYYSDIATYENLATLMSSGKAEDLKAINESVAYSYIDRRNNSIEALQNEISYQEYVLQTLKDYYAQNENEVTAAQITEQENRIQNLKNNLNAQTSTIDSKNEDFYISGQQNAQSYSNGLNSEQENIVNSANTIADSVKINISNIDSYNRGKAIVENFANGMRGGYWSVFDAATYITGAARFGSSSNVSVLQLPGHADGLEYVPYDNYVARLHKGERVLTAAENIAYNNEKINNSTISTKLDSIKSNDATISAIMALANRPVDLYINGKKIASAIAGDKDNIDGLRLQLVQRGLSI